MARHAMVSSFLNLFPVERNFKDFDVSSSPELLLNVLLRARDRFSTACFLNSNGFAQDPYGGIPSALAIGVAEEVTASVGGQTNAFTVLKEFSGKHEDWLFGFFSYDLKNQVERLTSENPDHIRFPLMHFFRPVILIFPENNNWRIGCLPGYGNFSDPDHVFRELIDGPMAKHPPATEAQIRARVSRERYLHQVNAIKNHIQLGDIYEMNYCVEFFAEQARIDPIWTYYRLNQRSPAPFSCFYSLEGKSLLCSSPERFLRKKGKQLVSQPIKGTAKRGVNDAEDQRLKENLYHDPKERSENVMIVDLVRNDLSRSAEKGSVEVEELFGIYSFPQVHQMISTVTARLHPDCHFVDAIRNAFPMGSMTGAPKVRAMQLIEEYEDMRRGLYSGAVGYISPEKDFDFNVVIRSILYNAADRYLAYMAGGAITSGSVPEKEYEECLLKAASMEAVVSAR